MTDDQKKDIKGMSIDSWEQAFRPGMAEYAAISFVYTRECKDLIRIAFGNSGPIIDETGKRSPRYTHAVTLPPDVALELAQQIIASYAKPEGEN